MFVCVVMGDGAYVHERGCMRTCYPNGGEKIGAKRLLYLRVRVYVCVCVHV